jgi:FlaA1/EpsC-like NDP-sugar epimerase
VDTNIQTRSLPTTTPTPTPPPAVVLGPGASALGLDTATVRRRHPRWHRRHLATLALCDAFAIAVAFGVAKRWLGLEAATFEVRSRDVPYAAIAFACIALWLTILALGRAYDIGPFGMTDGGARRVLQGGAQFLAVVAVAYYLLHLELLGRQLLVAMVPLSVGFTLLGRLAGGTHLRWMRRRGLARRRAVLVGSSRSIDALVQLTAERSTPVDPVATCVVDGAGRPGNPESAVTAAAAVQDLIAVVDANRADLVVVSSSLGPGQLRATAWTLEGSGVELLVATGTQPDDSVQLTVRPVAGLPLLYVEPPDPAR